MPTLRDQMLLSLAVYGDSDTPTAGWTRIDSNSDDRFRLQCCGLPKRRRDRHRVPRLG